MPSEYSKAIFYSERENVLEISSYISGKNTIEEKINDYEFLKEKNITQVVFIVPDSDPQSPREDDNCGTIISLAHRAFSSDKNADSLEMLVKQKDSNGQFYYDKEYIDGSYVLAVDNNTKNNVVTLMGERVCILPIYMYSHSGETISTTPFSCRWDSGLVGYIYMTATKAKENGFTKGKNIDWKKVNECLKSEIKVYDMYIKGDVYGFRAFEVIDNEVQQDDDSCWGFLGYDEKENGMEEHYLPAIKKD